MIISEVEVRACTHKEGAISDIDLRGTGKGSRAGMEFLVVTVRTDVGIEASSFGFAGQSAVGSAAIAATAIRPLLVGRDPFDHAAIWREFRTTDRWWNHLPIYSYGPFDIALWVLCATASNLPLYKFIGACQEKVPAYCSSLVL